MPAVAERLEPVALQFEAFRRDERFGTGALASARTAAFDRFLARGFPTTRDEEWRFTNVAPIAGTAFVRAPEAAIARAQIEPFVIEGATRLVLVNGRLSTALSTIGRLPEGVTVGGLRERADEMAVPHATAFADLNAAFFEDGLSIAIAPKAIVAAPIQVLCVAVATEAPVMASPRIRIVAGEQAQVAIVETYASLGPSPVFTNVVTGIEAGASAIVRHVKLQREADTAFHLSTSVLQLARASSIHSTAITLGGRIARNDISATLDGEGAECTLNGLYLATGQSLVDTHTTIHHAKAHCPSHELYKGILGGRARAVFNGKIVVAIDAQKTDAKQTNRALLLSDEAQINTKPQLEIFADDVKCTHGAAIGQLDEDAMFYLRSRGLPEADARNILIHAFAGEVLDGIGLDAVRAQAMQLVEDKLGVAAV